MSEDLKDLLDEAIEDSKSDLDKTIEKIIKVEIRYKNRQSDQKDRRDSILRILKEEIENEISNE